MAKDIFDPAKPEMWISRLRTMAAFAIAYRNGERPNQAEIGRQLGIPEARVSDQLKQIEQYYGLKLRSRKEGNDHRQGELSPLDKVLGDHALQFWAYDFLLREMLADWDRSLAVLGEEFCGTVLHLLSKGAADAIDMANLLIGIEGDGMPGTKVDQEEKGEPFRQPEDVVIQPANPGSKDEQAPAFAVEPDFAVMGPPRGLGFTAKKKRSD